MNPLVSDLSPLGGMTNLDSSHLDGNQMSDIHPLVKNPWLDLGDGVVLSNNPLNDASRTIYMPELRINLIILVS